jgi:hypothetical protein
MWTSRSSVIISGRLIGAAQGNNVFVVVSDEKTGSSVDGEKWTVGTPQPHIGFQTLAYVNNNFVAAGTMNNISMFFTSPDGINSRCLPQ